MISLVRTDATNQDFRALVQLLDVYLAKCDGDDHAFYASYNKLETIKHVIVAYIDGKAVACGAIRPYTEDTIEVKRMYVREEERGKGLATVILGALEAWAAELGYKKTILETGKNQSEAIILYERRGYQRIPNFGQYQDKDYSLSFSKTIN